jgi:hypothetical protein
MTFKSKENDPQCGDGQKQSQVKFQVKCNKELVGKPEFKKLESSVPCEYLFTTEHIAGCGVDVSILLGL